MPQDVIDGIMAMQADRESPVGFSKVFSCGDPVTLAGGPSAGLSAIFQAQSGKGRVPLCDLLGRGDQIEVNSDRVVPT